MARRTRILRGHTQVLVAAVVLLVALMPATSEAMPGDYTFVTPNINGGDHNGIQATAVDISDDGCQVLSISDASDLVPSGEDNNGNVDAYVWDCNTQAMERVSLKPNGAEFATGIRPLSTSMSGDGRFIAFVVEDPSCGVTNTFVRDRFLDTTTVIPVPLDGDGCARIVFYTTSFSGDGRWIALNGAGGGQDGIHMYDRIADTRSFAVRATRGMGTVLTTFDGDMLMFETPEQFVDDDNNGIGDVYVYTQSTGLYERVSLGPNAEEPIFVTQPSISSNGRYVVWGGAYALDGVRNPIHRGWIHDRDTGRTRLVNVGAANGLVVADTCRVAGESGPKVWDCSNGRTQIYPDGSAPVITPDGLHVAFSTNTTEYVPHGHTGALESYLLELAPAATTEPDPPTDVTATAGNAKATVSWEAPEANGGSDITGYTVTASPGGRTATVTGATTTTADVAPLTNGQSYTFTVVATNGVGDSVPSSPPSNAVIPNAPPSDPTGLGQFDASGISAITVGQSTDSTTVQLKGTVSDPDADDVRLEIEVEPVETAFDALGTKTSTAVASGSTASVTVSGLSRGVSYHWRARALDEFDATSGWVTFGGNTEEAVDFRIERLIVFTSNRHGTNNASQQEIYSLTPDGATAVRLTTNTVADVDPVVSPLGDEIAFVSARDGDNEIYVMRSDGVGVPRQLTINGATDAVPAWSPDGSQIVFSSNRAANGNFDLWVMNANGSGIPKRLTFATGTDSTPSWCWDTPTDQRIVFTSARDKDEEIFFIRSDGTGEMQLTNNKQNDSYPAWSPDCSQIAFSSNRLASNNYDLFLMTAAGVGQAPLLARPGNDIGADWSRSRTGSRLVFQGVDTDGDLEIYRVGATGLGLTKLSNNNRTDATPTW